MHLPYRLYGFPDTAKESPRDAKTSLRRVIRGPMEGGQPLFVFFGQPADSRAVALRLRAIERKLDLIMDKLGIPLAESDRAGGLPKDVRDASDLGNKIEAIKIHREMCGSNLRDAKDAVEAYLLGK